MKKILRKSASSKFNRVVLCNCPSNKDECKAAQGCFC